MNLNTHSFFKMILTLRKFISYKICQVVEYDSKMNIIKWKLNFVIVVQFWSEIKLVITYHTPAARSCDFVITRLISDQIALHSVQLPLLIGLHE